MFLDKIKRAAGKFDLSGQVRIISHLDSDGICSAAILSKAFSRAGVSHQISIVPQLSNELLKQLARTNNSRILFSDVGSSHTALIQKYFEPEKVLVLDHHKPNGTGTFLHINPHFFGIQGGREICGAGICYLFAKELSDQNKDLAYIAVIGAIGDSQEKNGLVSFNKDILNEALDLGQIKTSKGLRIFGASTKPLSKSLEHCFDPFIPNVSGSAQGTREFLDRIGLKGHLKLRDLDKQEMKKLVDGIIENRRDQKNPGDVLGTRYRIMHEDYPFDDAREFSTILNACGRLDKASIGVSALLGNKNGKTSAARIVSEYRKEILDAIEWYRKGGPHIYSSDGFVLVDARENIKPTIAGTLASMLARGGELRIGTIVLVIATSDDKAKISVRISGRIPPAGIDARKILAEIIHVTDGEYGGHGNAAGALISIEESERFIETAKEVLKKYAMIENV